MKFSTRISGGIMTVHTNVEDEYISRKAMSLPAIKLSLRGSLKSSENS